MFVTFSFAEAPEACHVGIVPTIGSPANGGAISSARVDKNAEKPPIKFKNGKIFYCYSRLVPSSFLINRIPEQQIAKIKV
jgi:hypothetical protein